MIIILGLVILVVAAIAGVAAVLGNAGHGHALTSGFSMLGYHVTGSTGTLFLYGIVVGAVAMLGLALLLGGARRSARRGTAARRSLKQSRRETTAVTQDRDDLIGQRDEAVSASAAGISADSGDRLSAASMPADSDARPSPVRTARDPASWLRGLGRRPAPQPARLPQQAEAQQPAETEQPARGQAVPDVPAEDRALVPAEDRALVPAEDRALVPAEDPASV